MKRWMKRKRNIITLAVLAMSVFPLTVSASTTQKTDYFTVEFYDEGEYAAKFDGTSLYTLSDWQKNATMEAAKYWGSLLKAGQGDKSTLINVATNNDNNALCNTALESYDGEEYAMGYIEAYYKGANVPDPKTLILIGKPFLPPTVAEQENYTPLWQQGNAMVYSILVHELGHGVGIILHSDKNESTDTYYCPENISTYNAQLYDWRGINMKPNMTISMEAMGTAVGEDVFWVPTNNDEKDPALFNAVYFKGENVDDLLDGASLQVYNYAGEKMDKTVPGVPVNGWEDNNGAKQLDVSHLELRNGLMSHQNFRNYSTFMEAELAVVKDLGYDIDLRSLFGRSVYGDGLTLVNSDGFSARNAEGTDYLDNEKSTVPYGVGLHVYGSNNNITQTGDILAAGPAAVGVRIDGVNNKITIAGDTEIHGDGYNGIGILTAFGKNHELTLEEGSEVTAEGNNGVGLVFDFGQSITGSQNVGRGSYAACNDGVMTSAAKVEVDGPLVQNLNINGKVSGQAAAIKISENAFVKNIQVGTGAELSGDIINNWIFHNDNIRYPKGTGNDLEDRIFSEMARQYESDEAPVTKLDFTGTNLDYAGNITGEVNTRLVVSGSLNYTGMAKVLSVDVAEGATLSGKGEYSLPDTAGTNVLYYETWHYDGSDSFPYGNSVEKTLNNVGIFTNKGTVSVLDGDMKITGDMVNSGNLNLYDGNLNIKGNFQNSGNIGLATENGQLVGAIDVTGTAAVTGGKLITKDDFTPFFDTKYTYLSAAGGLTGGIEDTYALNDFVKLSTKKDGNTLQFTANRVANLQDVAASNNTLVGVEGALDNWTKSVYDVQDLSPAQLEAKTELTSLYYTDKNTLNTAFKAMKGESRNAIEIANPLTSLSNRSVLGRMNNYAVVNTHIVENNVTNLVEPGPKTALAAVDTTVPVSLDTPDNFWGSMFKGQDKRGMGNVNSNTFGGILGYDHGANLTDRVGGFVSYGKSSYGGDSLNADSHDWRVGAYGRHINGDWTYQGVLSYGANRYDTKHYVLGDAYNSKYDMKLWDVTAKAIYNVPSARNKTWQVQPYGQLEYTHGNREEYTEQGGVFAQKIEGKNYNTTTAEVGVELARKLGDKGSWGGSLGYKRVLSCADQDLRGSFAGSGAAGTGFDLKSADDKNYLTYNLKAKGSLGGRWSLEGQVQGEFSAHNHDELYSVMAKYSF